MARPPGHKDTAFPSILSSPSPIFPAHPPLCLQSYPSYLSLHSTLYSTLPSRPPSMLTVCAGSQKDTGSCGCTAFIPKKSNESKCKSCGHWKTSHSNIPATPPQDVQTNTATIAKSQDHTKYVDRLYRSLVDTT